VNDFLIRL